VGGGSVIDSAGFTNFSLFGSSKGSGKGEGRKELAASSKGGLLPPRSQGEVGYPSK